MRPSRRRALLAAAASLAALGAGAFWWHWRATRPPPLRLPDGHPLLRMPVPAGTVVLCQQGNGGGAGRTHALPNCLHALDFSNPAQDSVDVISAAPGRVAYVFAGAKPGDTEAGLRFGNHLTVSHNDGYYTFYAHLDEVVVQVGQPACAVAKLGSMGMTGAAGNRHLHFSLHRGDPVGMGAAPTVPMRALLAADLSAGGRFERLQGADFIAGPDHLWEGHLYGSENAPPKPPLVGTAPPALGQALASAHRQLRLKLADRIALRAMEQWQEQDVAWAEAQLRPMLERDPDDGVARYWLAVAVHQRSGNRAEASKIFRELLAAGPRLPTWETWLRSASHIRLGEIAFEEGHRQQAEQQFVEGARQATTVELRQAALDHLAELRQAAAEP